MRTIGPAIELEVTATVDVHREGCAHLLNSEKSLRGGCQEKSSLTILVMPFFHFVYMGASPHAESDRNLTILVTRATTPTVKGSLTTEIAFNVGPGIFASGWK